jgi:hypothetical protein
MGIVKSNNIMSWAIYTKGTPEEVVKALEEHSNSIDGQCKEEYDSALPHLIALVKENIGCQVLLNAGGHGSKNEDGTWAYKYSTVDIRQGA